MKFILTLLILEAFNSVFHILTRPLSGSCFSSCDRLYRSFFSIKCVSREESIKMDLL